MNELKAIKKHIDFKRSYDKIGIDNMSVPQRRRIMELIISEENCDYEKRKNVVFNMQNFIDAFQSLSSLECFVISSSDEVVS